MFDIDPTPTAAVRAVLHQRFRDSCHASASPSFDPTGLDPRTSFFRCLRRGARIFSALPSPNGSGSPCERPCGRPLSTPGFPLRRPTVRVEFIRDQAPAPEGGRVSAEASRASAAPARYSSSPSLGWCPWPRRSGDLIIRRRSMKAPVVRAA